MTAVQPELMRLWALAFVPSPLTVGICLQGLLCAPVNQPESKLSDHKDRFLSQTSRAQACACAVSGGWRFGGWFRKITPIPREALI